MRIARISGFEIKLHWSTFVVFSLIVFSLATVQLPARGAGYGQIAYWGAAVLSGLAFYASLLAHELSHAVVARREGIGVQGLTLWMLGGIAALDGEPKDPRSDLRIAGVGPAVSVALAVAFGAMAAAVAAVGGPPLAQATLVWLAGINALLAVFNLVPAAPLDGGRILRAILWRRRGDRRSAAVAATRAGEVFGYLLVGLGLARLLLGVGVGGLWFVFVGWFLLNAARAERGQVIVGDALGDLKVSDVMTADPATAPAHIDVATLLDDYIMRSRHSAFPLIDSQGRPAGLVTLDQVRGVPRDRRGEVSVRDVACGLADVATAGPGDPLLDAVRALNGCGQGRILVLQDDRLVGILTPTDVSRTLERRSLDEPVIDVRDRSQVISLPEADTHRS